MTVSVAQATVCKKIVAYLQQKKASKAMQDMFAGDGLCFGFSVCYSAMHQTGKLAWWQHTLAHIAEWDETEASLTLEVEEAGKRITIESLFERAVSYIAFDFADSKLLPGKEDLYDPKKRDNFSRLPLTQQTFLDPGGLFEVSVGDEVKRVKTNVKAVGHFTASNLAKLLKPEFIAEAMLIIENFSHACSIRYEDSRWYFYDPNHRDGEQAFDSAEALAAEVIKQIGRDLNITLASFKEEDSKLKDFLACYDSIPLADRLQGYGLQIFYRFGFNLQSIVRNVQAGSVPKGLFIDALLKGEGDYFGLTMLANTNFALVDRGLEIILSMPDGKERLAEVIAKKIEGIMLIYFIEHFYPTNLSELIELAMRTKDGQENLMYFLKLSHDGSRKNLLSLLANAAESVVPDVLKVIQQQQEHQSVLLDALFIRDSKGNMPINQLEKYSEEIITTLIHPYDTVEDILVKMACLQYHGAKRLVDNNMMIVHGAIENRIKSYSLHDLFNLQRKIDCLPYSKGLYRREEITGRLLKTVLLKATLGIIQSQMYVKQLEARRRQHRDAERRVAAGKVGFFKPDVVTPETPPERVDSAAAAGGGASSPMVISAARHNADRDLGELVKKVRLKEEASLKVVGVECHEDRHRDTGLMARCH